MLRSFSIISPLFAFVLAGCSSTPAENTAVVPHPLQGKVLYDGKPAEGVDVFLLPTDAPSPPRIPRNPWGKTAADGTFHITTFTDGDGAAEGGYIVILNWPKAGAQGGSEAPESDGDQLLGWYDAAHSNLNVRVKAGIGPLPTYDLPKRTSPPKPSAGIPGRN